MTRDRWQGLLQGTVLEALAEAGARRRFGRERADEEDVFEVVDEDAPVALAASDARRFAGGGWVVVVEAGSATQQAGSGGLALRFPSGPVPLARGVPVPLPVEPGDVLEGVDAQGRAVRLDVQP